MNAFSEQTRFERYRLMLITRWPESDLKQAALASARAAGKKLAGAQPYWD